MSPPFANTKGGSLFFGIDDSGDIIGLECAQADAEFISQEIKAHLDPIPDFELIPHKSEDKVILRLKFRKVDKRHITTIWMGIVPLSSVWEMKVFKQRNISCSL